MKIKEGLEKEYEEYVSNNKDEYGKCAIDAGESVGIALDEGKTPEEAIEKLHDHKELTGFLAGAAIQGTVHFNPRGDDLRKAWNKMYGIEEEGKGVVNPAIITLDTDK